MTTNAMPATALLLGLGGLIPFAAAPALQWLGMSIPPLDDPVRAFVGYGAVILSFLGGVRWGFALRMVDGGLQARALLLSVVPSLAAWLLLLAPQVMGVALIPALFLLLYLADRELPRIGVPGWYPRLRLVLTAGVVLAALALLAALAR